MKTQWIKTGTGLYMQIIVPDEPGRYEYDPPTPEEQTAAAARYLTATYGDVFKQLAAGFARVSEACARYAETLDILNDPETLEAIREGMEDEDLSRWENEGGAVNEPDRSD